MREESKVYWFFASLLIFSAPFTGLPFFKTYFREASGEGLVYITILISPFILLFTYQSRFIVIKPVKVTTILAAYALIGILIQINHLDMVAVGRGANIRFISQFLSLCFVIYFLYVSSNIFMRLSLPSLMKIMLRVFFFQIAIIYLQIIINLISIPVVSDIYVDIFSNFIDKETLLTSWGRPHGTSQEPSHITIFFLLVWPIFIHRYKLLSPLGILVLLALISMQSRSLILIVLIQTIVFYRSQISFKKQGLRYFIVFTTLVSVALWNRELLMSAVDIKGSGSTLTRYVAAVAALQVFLKFPIVGAGLGLTGFYSQPFFDILGLNTTEIVDVVNGERLPFIHNMHLRILADLGLIGFGIWIRFVIRSTLIHRGLGRSEVYSMLTSLSLVYPLIFMTKENLTFMGVWLYTIILYVIQRKATAMLNLSKVER